MIRNVLILGIFYNNPYEQLNFLSASIFLLSLIHISKKKKMKNFFIYLAIILSNKLDIFFG